ncbi:MAG: VCBS repeat-containing protein [Nitrospirota bacterium]
MTRREKDKGNRNGLYCLNRLTYALLIALCPVLYALCFPVAANADGNLLNGMRDETVSYFKPMTGRVIKVEGQRGLVNLGTGDSVKTGMRFTILREGATFIHPVTKKALGKLEFPVGRLEIKEAGIDSSMGIIITGEAKEGDKVRISETQVSMLFCQSGDIDWYIADSYYRVLKETGRFNLIETGIETDDPQGVIKEAKRLNAEVALLLTSRIVDSGMLLTQRLFWVSDGLGFAEMDTKIDAAYAKEMRFGEEFFTLRKEEAWLQVDLPFGVRLLTVGDIDGDGNQEILLSTGKDVRIYTPGADLQPALGGIHIKGSNLDDHLWIETIDLNENGRDEIIVTSMRRKAETEDVYRNGRDEVTLSSVRSGGIVSYIYELRGTEFVLLYKDNVFLRRIEKELIAQDYSKDEGFTGDVFSILWEGEYKRGSSIGLPEGINIYDFIFVDDSRTGRLILAYDDKGFLNLYDKDIRLWRSKTDTGGFLTTFKKSSPSILIDRGEWAIKDRLFLRNREVLLVKRIPFLEMARGLGYKRSQIKNLWWDGLSMEEGVMIDDIKGSVLDYAVIGDKVMVLVSPMFGIKPENILKGENPLGSILYIYSVKRG